ncbi:MAG: Cof-type HAD-IIB family hydrolase [Phycisphaera sp.]|nr:Cof-type HAD-IIB family hydrolase [Phycisphaera sp.]
MVFEEGPGLPASSGTGPKFGLVAIDLDGTLLRSDKQLTKRTATAIKQCVQRGVQIVLASARPPRAVKQIYKVLGLDTLTIHYNGAMIYDMHAEKHIYHRALDPQLALQMIRTAQQIVPGVVSVVEVLNKWYTDRADPRSTDETALSRKPDYVGPLNEQIINEPVTKLMLLATPAAILEIRAAFEELFPLRYTFAASDDYLVQVMQIGVDKATALKFVSELYGVEQKKVMAIGDAPNDIKMLQWAGMGVAVGNAYDETKAAADAVVPTNDQDGVAHALIEYVLGGD